MRTLAAAIPSSLLPSLGRSPHIIRSSFSCGSMPLHHQQLHHAQQTGHHVPGHHVPGHQVPSHQVPGHQVPDYQVPGHDVPGHQVPSHCQMPDQAASQEPRIIQVSLTQLQEAMLLLKEQWTRDLVQARAEASTLHQRIISPQHLLGKNQDHSPPPPFGNTGMDLASKELSSGSWPSRQAPFVQQTEIPPALPHLCQSSFPAIECEAFIPCTPLPPNGRQMAKATPPWSLQPAPVQIQQQHSPLSPSHAALSAAHNSGDALIDMLDAMADWVNDDSGIDSGIVSGESVGVGWGSGGSSEGVGKKKKKKSRGR